MKLIVPLPLSLAQMMMDPTATMLHGDEDMLDDLERAKRANMINMGMGMGGVLAGGMGAGGGMADGIIPGAPGAAGAAAAGMGFGMPGGAAAAAAAARRRGILASTGGGESIYGGTKSMYNGYDGTAKSLYDGYDGSPASNIRSDD